MKEGLTQKVQIMIAPSLVAKIDDWRFANREVSRSRAMRKLLGMAIDAQNEKGPESAATDPDHGSSNPHEGKANEHA